MSFALVALVSCDSTVEHINAFTAIEIQNTIVMYRAEYGSFPCAPGDAQAALFKAFLNPKMKIPRLIGRPLPLAYDAGSQRVTDSRIHFLNCFSDKSDRPIIILVIDDTQNNPDQVYAMDRYGRLYKLAWKSKKKSDTLLGQEISKSDKDYAISDVYKSLFPPKEWDPDGTLSPGENQGRTTH